MQKQGVNVQHGNRIKSRIRKNNRIYKQGIKFHVNVMENKSEREGDWISRRWHMEYM